MNVQPGKRREAAASLRFTRRQFAGTLCFALLFLLLFAAAERVFFDPTVYCTTWNRVREQKTVPEVLILGNSHAYCSFVPDIINAALGVDSAVLSATGQDCLSLTDAFETVLQTAAPKLAIVEMNAFYFEPGSMARDNKRAALANINAMPGALRRAAVTYREFTLNDVPQGAFQLLRADLMWSRWARLFAPKEKNRYRQADVLGYGRLDWFATGDYHSDDVRVTGDPFAADSATKLQESSQTMLRRFLDLARAHEVEVWLVKAPVASRESAHPNGTDTARVIAAEYGDTVTYCHDYNDDLPALSFTVADFYDGGHLNRRGAAKFTDWFAKDLGERLGVTPDWTRAFAYRDESIAPLPNGRWRYTMIAGGERVLYRFETENEAGDRTLLRDWSAQNSVECDIAPQNAARVIATMCPQALLEKAETFALQLPFMTANSCVLLR